MDKAPDAFRTISEVAEELAVPQHVLRFWETRFAHIRPLKRGGGRRYYRPDDVDLLRGIRHLLYGQGYTIRGVQRILKDSGPRFVQAVWRSGAPQPAQATRGRSEEDHAGAQDLIEADELAPIPEEAGMDDGGGEGPPPASLPRRLVGGDPRSDEAPGSHRFGAAAGPSGEREREPRFEPSAHRRVAPDDGESGLADEASASERAPSAPPPSPDAPLAPSSRGPQIGAALMPPQDGARPAPRQAGATTRGNIAPFPQGPTPSAGATSAFAAATGSGADGPPAQPASRALSRDHLGTLRAALAELRECRRVLDAALRNDEGR